MKLVVTKRASRQLDTILDYIAKRNPSGARKVQARIFAIFRLLSDRPLVGQTTNRAGVRRMIAAPYPYIIFYRVDEQTVFVQRVRHAARRPML